MNKEKNIIEMLLDEIKNKKFNYLEINDITIIYNGKKPKGTLNNTTGAVEFEEYIIRRDIV